jgi:hypothetical protein
MKLFAPSILTFFLSAVVSYETNEARVVINGVQGDLTPADVQLVHDTIAELATASSVPDPKPVLRASVAAVTTPDDEDPMIETTEFVSWRRSRPAPAPVKPSCGGWGCGGWDKNNPTHQRGRWYGFGGDYSCGPLCKDDDRMLASALIFSSVHITNTDSANDERVCTKLRQQGSPALSDVTTCAVTPMYAGSPISSVCVDGAKSGEALVFVDGVAMTVDEAKVLETSVTEAYNEAYQKAGLVLQSFQALNIALPSIANSTSNEDDDASTVIMGEFHQLCTNVDPRDKTADMEWMHQMFEVMLCEKLRDSGVSLFQDVKTCAYRTFHNHATMKKNRHASSKKKMVRDTSSISEA